jgi:hypothetical protein
MNRCPPHRPVPRSLARALGRACTALVLSLSSQFLPAQSLQDAPGDNLTRQFPAQARRGVILFVAPPLIELDGQSARLSPGSRVRSTHNLIVLPTELTGLQACVNFTREATGQVHEVWILRPEEIDQRRAGEPASVQRNFRFASEPHCG